MAKLKATLTQSEYDALTDSLKEIYTQSGENWLLDAEGVEDVSGLKAKNAELLAELKKKGTLAKQFEGLDPDEARRALDELTKIEEKKLLDRQKFDELLAKKEGEYAGQIKTLEERYARQFASSADTDLRLKLIANGVREDLAEEFAIVLKAKNLKAVDENGAIVWKSLDDTETIELDKFIPSLKDTGKAVFFKSSDASGSGASGSGGAVGKGKTMPRSAFEQLPPKEQMDFSLSGGTLTD